MVPQTILSGRVFASDSLTSGSVKAYSYAGGAKGVLLASSTLSGVGTFQLSIPSSSGPVLLEAGGCYTDKAIPWSISANGAPIASNAVTATVCADAALSAAAVVSTTPSTQVVAVTPYTHAAVGLADYLARNGSSVSSSIEDATVRLSSWVGVDILTTQPEPPARAMLYGNASFYGALLAGIPSWVYNSATVYPAVFGSGGLTTLGFADAMKSDLAQDGVLNGAGRDANGLPASVAVGSAAMTTTIYRHGVALYANIRIRAETEGVVDATAAEQARIVDYLPSLVRYNDATTASHALLDGSALIALDGNGAVVTIGYPSPGGSLTGNQGMAGYIHDDVGIPAGNTVMLIDGILYTPFHNQYIPNNFINTTVFPQGQHILTIQTTNNLGRVSSASVTVTFY